MTEIPRNIHLSGRRTPKYAGGTVGDDGATVLPSFSARRAWRLGSQAWPTRLAAAQNAPVLRASKRLTEEVVSAQNGSYLESYLSTPRLTRASAAVTCSRTAFT